MKKRIVAALLVAVMSASLLAGCGSGAKDNKNTETTKDGKVKVDFWYSGGKTAVNVLQEIVDNYNKSQDKYEIVTTTQADYSETYKKVQAGIAGNNAPDIALLDPVSSASLSDKKLIDDLNKFIDADKEFPREDYLPVFFEMGQDKEGKTYAMPAYGTTQILYYNIAAFKEKGIDPASIKTWQDLAAAAKEMTRPDGSFYGWEPMWKADNLIDASLSNGASLLSKDGKTVTINSPEWVEVWESFRVWLHDEKIMKVNSGGQGWEYWYKTIDDVLQNKAGGYTGSSGDQADLDFNLVAAMEQPGFGKNPAAPVAASLQLVMLKGAEDKEKEGVYDFMKYFTNPENQAKWSMGTGYVAVRKSTQEVAEFKEYTQKNPQALVPLQQAGHASPAINDPTGGKIMDALNIACDQVELENVPAKQALDQAQKTAQEALDAVSK